MNILIVDQYLMVSRLQVNLQKYLGSSYLIEQVIDPREWVMVLDGHFFKLAVIDAHPHRTILLLYKKHRCSLRRNTWLDISFLNQLLQLQFEFHQIWCTDATRVFQSWN